MPITRSAASFSLFLTLCLGLPAMTHAAAPRLYCTDDPECDRLANEAREASKAGRFDDAQRSYEQAYQRRADPQLLFNLARVLHKAGRPAIAVIYYQKFIDSREVGADERRKAQEYVKQAQSEASGNAPANPATTTPATTPNTTASTTTTAAPNLTPTTSSDSSSSSETPLYKKWWLWTAVGAGAGIIIIGLAAGLAPRRPDLTGIPETHPFGN